VALVRWPWLRHVLETGSILCISLLLALLFPSSSAKVSLQPRGSSEGNPRGQSCFHFFISFS